MVLFEPQKEAKTGAAAFVCASPKKKKFRKRGAGIDNPPHRMTATCSNYTKVGRVDAHSGANKRAKLRVDWSKGVGSVRSKFECFL